MSRPTWFAASAASLLLAALVAGAPASAERGTIQLVSKDAGEQADSASEPAISGDGHYVAFLGVIDGRRGIFRKDLETGELVPVETGSAYVTEPGSTAAEPSISADGRYVSFTTEAPLDPADDGAGSSDSDVYVAAMDTSPPTYELASARDGCVPVLSATPCGLTYEGGGSVAAGRVALSADGREVAFVVTGKSDLMDPPGQVETPAGQVVVRDLETDRTTLVSVERDPATGAMTDDPVQEGAMAPGFGNGASLSADGSTVAWYGGHLPAQVPLLSDEREAIEQTMRGSQYSEPLWRLLPTVADPAPPTRRIVGGGDPLAPGCAADGVLADPACDGPYPDLLKSTGQICGTSLPGWLSAFAADGLPQLSANGRTVALIGEPDGFSNAFVVDMEEGLTRTQALRPVTAVVPIEEPCRADSPQNVAGTGPIGDIAISPDGNRIAFDTVRQQFPLSPPHLVTPLPGKVGQAELYLVDLAGHTVERLTPANLAEASTGKEETGGVTSPSFSDDGSTLAFSSTASNLVPGDANEESDVFVVTDSTPPVVPGKTSISPAPASAQPKRLWRLTASAVSLPRGRVKVRALVPGAGRLLVKARAAVGAHLAIRQVATARDRVAGEGLALLTLKLKHGYARLARGHGLPATFGLSFDGRGGGPLHFQLGSRFVASPGKGKSGDRHGGRR